jgi:hypothetical protein
MHIEEYLVSNVQIDKKSPRTPDDYNPIVRCTETF